MHPTNTNAGAAGSPGTRVAIGARTSCLLALLGLAMPAADADELVVAAAVSLKEAMSEIAQRFEQEHKSSKVVFEFAGSGQIAQQVRHGAPIDVFAAADKADIDSLDKAGLLAAKSIACFAGNQLVVVVPASEKKLSGINDLLSLKRIAIGDGKSVPAGVYAEHALRRHHIYDQLKGKLIPAESVRQVLSYVESGEVNAGFVYATDARTSKKVATCFTVSALDSGPISYAIAVVRESHKPELARQFIQLVTGRAGQAALAKRGFLPAQ